MLSYLIAGSALGMAAGFAPGPLLTMVISQTLQYGLKEGFKTSFAPLIADTPIIALTTFLVSTIYNVKPMLGAISITGSLFLAYLAYENLKINSAFEIKTTTEANSLIKGTVVNLLNPHPYLFWLTVGSPMVLSAYDVEARYAVAFLASFYFCLVGAKIVLALVVSKSRHFFSGRRYIYLMRLLGLALLVFGVILCKEGLALLLER